MAEDGGAPVRIPIDGTIDLHTFQPGEVRDLIPEYLDACRERGIRHVRVVHGKGIGALREIVHAILRRRPDVVSFGIADGASGWGATDVVLSCEPTGEALEEPSPGPNHEPS